MNTIAVPEINLMASFNDLLSIDENPPPTASNRVVSIIENVWKKLLPSDGGMVKRIDIVAEGEKAQMTPLVTRQGVVVRLDLTARHDLERDDSDSWNVLVPLVYHELYHLVDRLDPEFDMDYHLDSQFETPEERRTTNVVWDVYIERRKFIEHGQAAVSLLDIDDPREATLRNFIDLVGNGEVQRTVFEEIWDSASSMTYSELRNLAKRLEEAPGAKNDESIRRRLGRVLRGLRRLDRALSQEEQQGVQQAVSDLEAIIPERVHHARRLRRSR